jgi:hypothetical protein
VQRPATPKARVCRELGGSAPRDSHCLLQLLLKTLQLIATLNRISFFLSLAFARGDTLSFLSFFLRLRFLIGLNLVIGLVVLNLLVFPLFQVL